MTRLLDLYRHTDPSLRACSKGASISPPSRAPATWTRWRRPRAARRRRAAHRAGARLFRRRGRHRGEIPRARRTGRASARSPSTAGTRTSTKASRQGRLATLLGALDGALAAIETNMGEAWRETVVARGHRVRPHRAHQRHRRHRSRHRHRRAARRRRAQGRPRDRRLAGPQGRRSLREAAISSRPPTCAPCSRACSRITCASTSARWPTTVFPGSADVKPMAGLVASA